MTILEVQPVGNYAVRLVFDDMHSTGIFSWDYLSELGRNHSQKWQDYLDELAGKGLTRDPPHRRQPVARNRVAQQDRQQHTDRDDNGDPHRNDGAVFIFIGACRKLQRATLAVAERRGVSATRKAAERALMRIDAANVRRRRREELRGRDVYVMPEPDGMAVLVARLGIEQAQACLSAVTRTANETRLLMPSGTPDDSTVGERRAGAGELRRHADERRWDGGRRRGGLRRGRGDRGHVGLRARRRARRGDNDPGGPRPKLLPSR